MSRPFRICLLSQEFPPETNWGGVGVNFHTLAQAAARLGDNVVVVSRAAKGAPPFERRASGLDVWRVGQPIDRKLLVGRTVDRILHARAVATKVAALDSDHRFDVIEGPEAGLDGESLAANPEFVRRMIVSCHGSNLRGQAIGPLAPLHRLDWTWSARREEAMLDRVPMIVVPSEATRQVVLGQGIDANKVQLIPHGIDTARFHPRHTSRGGPLRVGFVGRLEQTKGIQFVWRVMERLQPTSGIHFHFKGAIHPAVKLDVLNRLREFAAFAEYHAPSSDLEMPDFYRSLDVMLLPSRFENFGLAYIEAMATGLVVFAGQGGSGPEVVRDGVTGFIVDSEGPVDSVVERLNTLAANRGAYERLSQAARADVVQRFSVESFATRKLELYRSLKRPTPWSGRASSPAPQ